MNPEATRTRARAVVEALSETRYRDSFDALAEDVETVFVGQLSPIGGTYTGKAARKELGKRLLADLAEIRLGIEDIIAEPDKAVVLARGTGRSRRLGMPYNNTYAIVLQFRDGLVVRWTEYLDTELVAVTLAAEAIARAQAEA